MLSPASSPTSDPKPPQNTDQRRFSLKNFALCKQLQAELVEQAIRRISADILKSLLAIKRNEFIAARNRVDIPHGMFGLTLEDFYERRKVNTVYLDVLNLICKTTLEQAKFCIVLDDLQNFASKLFIGYHSKKMAPILKNITNSEKLLTISETIVQDFKKNTDTLQKLRDKLNAFNIRERNALSYMNNQVYGVQNNCVEAELVLDPIEFRYKLSFHNRTTDQSEEKLREAEEELETTMVRLEKDRGRENFASECVTVKQRDDIEMLKTMLQETTEQFDRDYDFYDGQISYKTIAMETMDSQRRDCLLKMSFFATEKVKLLEWHEAWAIKKREEAQAVIQQKKKGKKGTKKGGENQE